MPTLFYAPAVEIHIGTANGTIDVSDDITAGQVVRIINGVSSAQFTLKNQGSKYSGLFDTMDKVVIYMRRLSKMLVFSGYLDTVPSYTIYSQTVTLKASCTLKLLQNWPWDPGSTAAYNLLYTNTLQSDADLSKKVIAMLTQVAQWPQSKIHIGQVPANWTQQLSGVADKLVQEADAAQIASQVGSAAWLNGTSTQGSTTIASKAGPGTGSLPTYAGRATDFGGGPATHPPSTPDPNAHGGFALTGEKYPNYQDLWYCAMRWPYQQMSSTGAFSDVPGVDVAKAIAWWRNRLIMVVNPATKRACAVRAADWGPASWATGNAIDLGPAAMAYLTNTEHVAPLGAIGAIDEVHISFAPAGITKTGPIDTNPASAAVGTALQDVTTNGGTIKVSKNDPTLGAQIVTYAQTFIGVPYVWGGSTPNGFDCSGLVQYVFHHFRINLPHNANEQSTYGIPIPAAQAQAGDLVFFHTESATIYNHVAICMGGGMMIAAPHTGVDVQEEKIYVGAAGPNLYTRLIGAPTGAASTALPKVCPFAIQKIMPFNDGLPAREDSRTVILHTNGGASSDGSLYSYFSRPDNIEEICSHFQIKNDGTIEQYVTTDKQAFAAFASNAYGIQVETEDDDNPSTPWTDKQIASILKIIDWVGCPAIAAPDSDSGGVGWHQEYTDWNTDDHDCPGSVRVAQIHSAIIPSVVPNRAGGGVVAPTTTAGGTNQAASSAGDNPADTLFNIWAWLGQIDPTSNVLGGVRALMNDVPVLTTIDSMMQAGMRQYCSAPNGDFIGWFPDYFGHYGTAARLIVEDIELQRDFAVAKSDPSLRTHVYVTSSAAPAPASAEVPGPTDIQQMVGTAGVATVEFPQLMKAIFGVDPSKDKRYSANYILQRYGARVDWTPMQNISGPRAEFFFAVMRFALNWAQQYAAIINLTFMPEAWPGMLLTLPKYGIQTYIKQVTHTFNLGPNGGFTTDVVGIALSSTGSSPIRGLPLGGTVNKVKS